MILRYDIDKIDRFKGTAEILRDCRDLNMHWQCSLHTESLLYSYRDTANPIIADALCYAGENVRSREDVQ